MRSVLLGVNIPEPPDQIPPVATEMTPAKFASGLFSQLFKSKPAETEGAEVNVTTISSDSALHVPFPVVVSVKVSVPEAISPAVGVYIELRAFALGVKTPKPPVH